MADKITQKIDKYFSKFPERVYSKGQMLVFAGESPNHIFYIVSGRVRQFDVSARGDEVIVNIYKPPAFFPMSWALNKTDNRYFLKAETETRVHLVPPDKALDFLNENPDVLIDLLSRVYRGMDGLLGRVVQLMAGTARTRLLYELILEFRRFGEPSDKGLIIKVNEQDLASRTGMSRETVNREIAKIKDLGIKVTSSGIEVKDLTVLEEALGAEI